MTGDQVIDLADYAAFAECLEQIPPAAPECACADLNGDTMVDLADFALLSLVFGKSSDETPPNCTGQPGTTADLVAYRPQFKTGYAPFAKAAVPGSVEADAALGPGIRINNPGDNDPQGEDDLIEVTLLVDRPGASMALRRSDPALAVWTTRNKQAGTEVAFVDDLSDVLPLGPAATSLTLWVEWTTTSHGTAEFQVEPAGAAIARDALVFHTFHSIVMALGGEDQPPSNPIDPNHGTFVVARALYVQGFDVHMYDEDVVTADGSGEAFDVVADAIQHRMVNEVAIYGYSHGGGSTYDLAERLDIRRAMLGVFDITFTSYVDSVSNNSDVDVAQELRRPPTTAYHANHYQHGSLFEDFFLDGGPVPNSNPSPTGLDVETTPWGATSTHFQVDDFVQVRSYIESALTPRVTR
jgi:hypothetical protein